MKPVTIAVAAALLGGLSLTGPVQAQESDLRDANSLKDGSWSVQFEFDSDFKIKSFDGALIALKYHSSDGGAWQIGADLALEDSETEVLDAPYAAPEQRTKRDIKEFTVSITRLFYPDPTSSIGVYFGVGPRLGWGLDHSVEEEDNYGEFSSIDREVRKWLAGGAAVFGIEYFPHRRIGILGQYGLTCEYSWERTKYTWDGKTPTTTKDGLRIGADDVRMGVSLYW